MKVELKSKYKIGQFVLFKQDLGFEYEPNETFEILKIRFNEDGNYFQYLLEMKDSSRDWFAEFYLINKYN